LTFAKGRLEAVGQASGGTAAVVAAVADEDVRHILLPMEVRTGWCDVGSGCTLPMMARSSKGLEETDRWHQVIV
jgi:hypothetical protein